MFYQLTGTLVHTDINTAVLDCGGVGYQLTVSGNTLGKISAHKEERLRLFTHLTVREDAIELFGFYEQDELAAFRMLISVSGVGPKSAMSILTLLSPTKFALAVTTEDAKLLAKAQGVGAKTAARIILDLKDKISKKITVESSDGYNINANKADNKLSDAQNTLMVLGYSRSEAAAALRDIDTSSIDLEEIIRLALKKMLKN
ncbi:MAG: Holliday junction branch migration protein RuvA [Eubacteriales bacterium]|nr:Holliday junction branch migration protein RuvA [Eubacteriales bacterium]